MQAPLAAQPTDVTVTPDGDFAIVRSTAPSPGGATTLGADHISVWDLSTRTRVPVTIASTPGQTPGAGEFTAGDPVADLVETTNAKTLLAGAIGSATFIDVMALPDALNPGATIFQSHTISVAAGTTNVAAGKVNDVAIVEARQIGIVNHHNQVHFVSMRTGAILAAFDLSRLGMPAGQSAEISPLGATDSIATTNDRAVVISTRYPAIATQRMPWVFIFNITNPAAITNTYASPFVDSTVLPEIASIARSVRIPADERQVVMTADMIVASQTLGAISWTPTGPPFPTIHFDPVDSRAYQVIRDSLEVTNTRAIALSTHLNTSSTEVARIQVFDISTVLVLGAQTPFDSASLLVLDRAHDLAIAPDGSTAVVKTELTDVVIGNLAGPGPAGFGVQSSNGNPLAVPAAGPAVFVSDSVAISLDGSTAITIGTQLVPGSRDRGTVEYIALTPPGVSGTVVMSDSAFDVYPTDPKFSRDNTRLLVRSAFASGLAPGSSGQALKILGLNMSVIGSLAADGNVFRLDSLEVGNGAAVAISETQPTTSGQVLGHVQLIQY